MARAGSQTGTTARTSRTRKSAADKATEAQVANTETPEAAPAEESNTEVNLNTEATEEADTVSPTDTIDETKVDETTEASVNTDGEKADEKAETPAVVEIDLTAFDAAVAEALTADSGYDTATGEINVAAIDKVKSAYRDLPGVKAKNKAKDGLTTALREAVTSLNVVLGAAVMSLSDAVKNAGSGTKAPADRKPADPKAAFVERLTALHLAYALVRGDLPEGVDADEAFAQVDEKVEALGGQADALFAWTKSEAEDKGDAPEVDAIVAAAVKAAQGKAVRTKSGGGTVRPASDGVRRNVKTHIAQVFADSPAGTVKKVSEVAKAVTAEYPDGTCSAGAVTAALKSPKGVPGFEYVTEPVGGARKL